MERLKKNRKMTRTSITKTANRIDEELREENPNRQTLLVLREEIIRLLNTIVELDTSIMDLLLDGDSTEEFLLNEHEEINAYRNKVTLAEIKVEDFLKIFNSGNELTNSEEKSVHTVVTQEHGRSKKTYKLPKIEIKKFNGQLLDWLSFWSQFEKIHEDNDLHDSDKFQYLSQAMVDGTRAKELVNSYPQTSENYPKVILALKERYGKKKILKQVYVRELIKMITANVNGKNTLLSKLFDDIESHIRALESLGVTIEQTSEFIFPLVESSLPEDILIAWQRSGNFGKDGTLEKPPTTELHFLMQFLKQEVESEQQRTLARASFTSMKQVVQNNSNEKKSTKTILPTAAGLHVGVSSLCIFCEKPHQAQDCMKAMNMTLELKRKIIKDKKGCSRCLKIHGTHRCKTWVGCSGCSQQHFHIMCPESPRNIEEKSNHCNSIAKNSNQIVKQVLLKTIRIKVKTRFGSKIVRVLFDDGSQQSYIKTSVARELKCIENGKYFERNTIFGGVLTNIEERTIYKVQLTSMDGKTKRDLELPNKDKITGEILKISQGPWLEELQKKAIHINDQDSEDEEIDILIGADLLPFLTKDESLTLDSGLKAVKTIFGWTVMGPILVPHSQVCLTHSMVVTLSQLTDANIKQLWDLELLGIRDPVVVKARAESDRLAELHFKRTVSRATDGRYVVELPWIAGHHDIPNNYGAAKKRLHNATKKLQKDGVYSTYDGLFQQWEEEGFIEKIIFDGNLESLKNYHFIPHHPVFKPSSTTTPVRPVFDASCKMGRYPSLNECLEKGPNLIELIPMSMLRFRIGRFGVLSDIRKAFQMIEVEAQDQNYLLFLWWEDATCTELVIFKHKRVVFGLKSSPFILAAVINHHLDNVVKTDKEIAMKLKTSLYVDNCITSVDSEEEYHHFKDNSTRIMADAKMELRQWEVSSLVTPGISLQKGVGLGAQVLGMKWDKNEDTLACASTVEIPTLLTKRTILATINKFFDPLGFLAPAMIYPKLILQSTWDLKIDWDEELPLELRDHFQKWCKQVHHLEHVKIPRKLKGEEFDPEVSSVQLHIFNDASQVAYATVVFLRVETRGNVSVQLVQSKARVAPMNKMTINRLELMGCVIGTRLVKSIQEELQCQCFYWTDSTTALSWIQRNDNWGTFVGNRVREIIGLSDTTDWRYVPGKLNPADLPSRGCSPRNLLESRWWEGPSWLKLQQSQWPNDEIVVNEELVNSEKKVTPKTMVNNVQLVTKDPWYAKKSSYLLCLRGVAWLKRFINNCLAKKRNLARQTGFLQMQEIKEAETNVIKMVQAEVFPVNSNYLSGLRVSQDGDNLYYVTTKIINRADTGSFRKPLLLPQIHPVVDKLVMEEHRTFGHAGIQFIINKLREKYWIIKTRRAVSRIIKGCVICKRFSTKAPTVPVAALPENRVKTAKAFEISGVDLAGPLYLCSGTKVWIVLFTCAVYRAVHIESVERINSAEFILALQRFISRKGRPSIIYTDNGTNFVGTANLFGRLDFNKIQRETAMYRIEWIFNPPAAPWWGGFWERLIRTIKEYLRKLLGQSKLNKVQLDTLLCFVESLINDRPLTYITEDQDDLIPLTPAAFLRDLTESEFPEIEVLNDKRFKSKYRDLVQLKQELRDRFRKEYFGLLIERTKPTDVRQFEEGEIVLVASDDKKRIEWPKARILKLLPGKDNEIRVAQVKTADGIITRPLQRLFPLEISSAEKPLLITTEAENRAKKIHIPDKVSEQEVVADISSVDEKDIEKVTKTTRYGRTIKKPIRF